MSKNIIIILFFLLWGCGKDSDYVHHRILKKKKIESATYQIQNITTTKVDILWVIDNSGSMSNIQNNIITNAKFFMENLIEEKNIDWQIGLVSTSDYEPAYLGFSSPFNSRTPDPVTTFQNAVSRLGINGSGSEYVFYSANRHLFLNNTPFFRTDAHLVIIMVSDEKEQSHEVDEVEYDAENFYLGIKSKISSRKILRFYGALGLTDLGCTNTGDNSIYAGSPYEKIVNISKGFSIPACSPNFGVELARIGRDISKMVEYPKILLSSIPKVETIEVKYKGLILPYGSPETGGYWYYDYLYNSIVFYNLDFALDFEDDQVDVNYQIDDGIIRSK